MMQELLEQFAALDAASQVAIMAVIAGGVVKVARMLGFDRAPGYQSVLASVLVGAATGAVANGWQGAVLGAIAGFAATGVHQAGHQAGKRVEDLAEAERRR